MMGNDLLLVKFLSLSKGNGFAINDHASLKHQVTKLPDL